jgi:hypothetical protein
MQSKGVRMQRILNLAYVVIVIVVLYVWVQSTPAGANLPKLTVPGTQPVASATSMAIVSTPTSISTSIPTATIEPTRTVTPSVTPTITPTATPAKFTTSVEAIVRKISNTRKLTTVETILDVVVTFDDSEQKLGWWDGGELLVQRTTVKAQVGVDLQNMRMQRINDRLEVLLPASTVLSLDPEYDQPYYFSKGIRYAFQDGQKDTWRNMIPAEVDKVARARICELGLHQQASDEASAYIVAMAMAMNPNMTEEDIIVNLAPATECPAP